MCTNLVESTQQILQSKYGPSVSKEFNSQIKLYSGGNYKNWSSLPANIQIRNINSFWRSVLSPLPDTVDIRAWLSEGESISAYIDAFDNNWSELAVATGVFNQPKLRRVS